VKALADFSTPTVKRKAFVLAADIAMSSGDVDESEDELLTAMQRILGVDDATADKVLEVLSMKYAR
jgi:tellurite resistance protein